MNRIFLSYARKDASDVAEWLYNRLTGCGFDVWKDKESLPLGGSFPKEISNAVSQQEYFLILLSAAAVTSEWVQEEIDLAKVARRQIIPIILEDVEVPLYLRTIQSLEMKGRTDDWLALHKLVNHLGHGKSIPRVYNMGHENIEVIEALVLGHSGFVKADLSDPKSIVEVAINLAQSALPFIKEAGAGIVTPGHPALACSVIAHLLGTMTQMPTIFCTHNLGNGKYRINGAQAISLQNIREQGFVDRSNHL